MRKFYRWLALVASSSALAAAGCTSTATTANGTSATTGWHWPWTKAAPLPPGSQMASESDVTSLANKPPKLGPDLYVATARVYEKNGDFDGASAQYKKALQADPNHLPALLGFAELEDSQKHYGEADHWYQEAMKRHPKEAAVYNDRGLSLQRRGKLDDAVRFFARAIELQPDKPLYRNNIAAVLVAMQRNDEALSQLTYVHGPAVGHYNLAILLHRKGVDQDAQYHFAVAAQMDPRLDTAREWAERLSPAGRQQPPVVVDGQMPVARPLAESTDMPSRPMIVQAPPGLTAPHFVPPSSSMPPSAQPTFAPPQQAMLEPQQSVDTLRQPTLAPPRPAGPRLAALPPQPMNDPIVASQPTLAPQQPLLAMNGPANQSMRYPQGPRPANSMQGAIPPSPDRLNEMPSSADNVRPLPPLQ